MDLFTKLTTIYGKDCVLILIEKLNMYDHSFAIHLQHIDPQESKPLFGFHGPFGTTFSDGIGHFLEDFGQEFLCLVHIQPTPNFLYYFQVFEKIMAASKWLDGHLSYDVFRQLEAKQH